MRVLGPPAGAPSTPLAAFQVKSLDSGAVAKSLGSRANIIVRSGFLCAQPAYEQLSLGPTVRASFGVYNNATEVDLLIQTVEALTRFLH